MGVEVRQQTLWQPVDAARQGAVHKDDMAAVKRQFQSHGRRQALAARQCRRRQSSFR